MQGHFWKILKQRSYSDFQKYLFFDQETDQWNELD